MQVYQFTMRVAVSSEKDLYEAAFARALTEGHTPETADECLLEDGEVDAGACISMLADPGESWPGTEIEDSECEYLFSDEH